MSKITLLAENLWILRSKRTKPDGTEIVVYYETPARWNKSPMAATMFSCMENAEEHLRMYNQRDKAPKGWADGSKEVIDAVPLFGEMMTSPNVIKIEVKKDTPDEER